ncbi:MAG: hypothetical protein P8Y27_14755 [Chromatiaceae bacterium]|jgi:hypothetical protein
MRLEREINSQPRLLRKSAPDKGDETARAKGQTHRSQAEETRFIGATHLDERQKTEISRALEKRRIGDEMGRQIFVVALEYQLTVFRAQLEQQSQADPKAVEAQAQMAEALQGISAHARLLAPLLRELPEQSKGRLTEAATAQDARGRTYDHRYLCELGCEIDRLEQAAAAAAEAVQPEPVRYDPTPSRPFVAKLAKVYAECFEEKPTADTGGGFAFALETIETVTGLIIGHEAAFLAEILH